MPDPLSNDPKERLTALRYADDLNREFYNRITFPPPPQRMDLFEDPHFESRMLQQALGSWEHDRIPENAAIWVPGCGSYHANLVALQFPAAQVLGSDLADQSLAACGKAAGEIGIENLTLREESLLATGYHEAFDYIICSGVLHHLPDPAAGLCALAKALRPDGILELMIYNRFNRIASSAYQEAIRTLCQGGPFETQLRIAKKVVEEHPLQDRLGEFLGVHADADTLFADTFLQPIEHSYTVSSLREMARACSLELLQPRVTLWDKRWNTYHWNLQFLAPELRGRYVELDDLERWSVTNHLAQERSPLLWFYLQRKESGRPRKDERQICDEFLRRSFRRAETAYRSFLRDESNVYRPLPSAGKPYPGQPVDGESRSVVAAADGATPMETILERLGLARDFLSVNRLRLKLTTPAFPFLVSAGN